MIAAASTPMIFTADAVGGAVAAEAAAPEVAEFVGYRVIAQGGTRVALEEMEAARSSQAIVEVAKRAIIR